MEPRDPRQALAVQATVAPMSAEPLRFLLWVFAGWANRRHLELIEYLKEENRVLREQLTGRPLRFTDVQRRRLAVKGRVLGRRVSSATTRASTTG